MVNKIIFIILFLVFPLQAREKLLDYKEVKRLAEKYLKKQFPFSDKDFLLEELPAGNKILRKTENQYFVYYYQYKIQLPVYVRDNLSFRKNEEITPRLEIVWVRVIPHQNLINLTFLDFNYLPGNSPVWLD